MSRPRRGSRDDRLRLVDRIGRAAERKRRARGSRRRGLWFGLGMFGLVGWAVAVPALIAVALGRWLDHRVAGRVSWTATLLLIGIVLGCVNAWYWVRKETRRE